MSNDGFPILGRNLSCVRHIDFVMQPFVGKIVDISVFFQVFVHEGNCRRFLIKWTYVHHLNAQPFVKRQKFR